MKIEWDVFPYVQDISRPGIPLISDSHHTLRRLYEQYGEQATTAEVNRQLRMRQAFDYPRLDPKKFVVVWMNGVRWPDGARQVSYASITNRDIHDNPLWTCLWEEAAVFDSPEQADAYNQRLQNPGEVVSVWQVLQRGFL